MSEINPEIKYHRDSMFDRKGSYMCRDHGHFADEFGECPYCINGQDPLGEWPSKEKIIERRKNGRSSEI